MIESDVPSCPKDGSKMVRVPIRWASSLPWTS